MAVCRPMPELPPVTRAIFVSVDSVFGMHRANHSVGAERENRTAASMHNPARSRCWPLSQPPGTACDMYVPAHGTERGAAGADRPARAPRRDDGDRRRPALGRRPAGRAAGVDHRDGHGADRPGREAPGHRRSRVRLRPRPVPGRLRRPADHRALHARIRGRAGPGVRPDPPAVSHRVAAPGRADAGPQRARAAPAPAGSASPTPRPSSSTPSCAWCACSTARATATSSRR